MLRQGLYILDYLQYTHAQTGFQAGPKSTFVGSIVNIMITYTYLKKVDAPVKLCSTALVKDVVVYSAQSVKMKLVLATKICASRGM